MSNVPYVAPDALGVTLEHIDKGPSVDDVVKMVRRATNITKLKDLVAYGNRKKLWGLCRRYLTGWAIASAPHRFSTSDLSTPQRKFKIVPSFDIRELLDSELDLVVLLACSKVGPLSRKKFSKVYIQCCTHVPLGKAIRKILQNRFDQDKFISEVVSRKTSTGPPSSDNSVLAYHSASTLPQTQFPDALTNTALGQLSTDGGFHSFSDDWPQHFDDPWSCDFTL